MRTSLLVAVLAAAPALAGDLSFRVEPGVAIPLGAPQSDYLAPGGGLALTFGYGLTGSVDFQVQAGAGGLPQKSGVSLPSAASLAWAGLGARFRKEYDESLVYPWGGASAHFNYTGVLPRASLELSGGVNFRLSDSMYVGPHVRYLRVFGIDQVAGTLTADANLLMAGVTLEFTTWQPKVKVVEPPPPCPGGTARGADGACLTAPPPPPPAPVLVDTDKDGVLDDKDKCPTEAEDRDGFQDEDGCPDPDNDGDGVLDTQDRCPDIAGTVGAKGCPDKDGDTVPDAIDGCPEKAGLPEAGGCPTYKAVKVTESKLEINQKIFFAFGKSDILPKSFGLLDEVVSALTDHKRLCVRIEGHTDSKGNSAQNLKLSDGRAGAVRTYVVQHGIDPERLASQGYGDTQPLDDNKTSEGREKNRRVEFVLVPCNKKEVAP